MSRVSDLSPKHSHSSQIFRYQIAGPGLNVDQILNQLANYDIQNVRVNQGPNFNGFSIELENPTSQQLEGIRQILLPLEQNFENMFYRALRPLLKGPEIQGLPSSPSQTPRIEVLPSSQPGRLSPVEYQGLQGVSQSPQGLQDMPQILQESNTPRVSPPRITSSPRSQVSQGSQGSQGSLIVSSPPRIQTSNAPRISPMIQERFYFSPPRMSPIIQDSPMSFSVPKINQIPQNIPIQTNQVQIPVSSTPYVTIPSRVYGATNAAQDIRFTIPSLGF